MDKTSALDMERGADMEAYKTIGSPLVKDAKMSARTVNVFYAEKQAILDVSLDIGRNEVLAMIGPSGCGKSTFLRTLNRMNDIPSLNRFMKTSLMGRGFTGLPTPKRRWMKLSKTACDAPACSMK